MGWRPWGHGAKPRHHITLREGQMQNTSNAAAAAGEKAGTKTGTEKVSERVAEKRRALGRGLESLLPGPRVVPASPTLPQSTRKDGAPASSLLSSASASGFSSGAERSEEHTSE